MRVVQAELDITEDNFALTAQEVDILFRMGSDDSGECLFEPEEVVGKMRAGGKQVAHGRDNGRNLCMVMGTLKRESR